MEGIDMIVEFTRDKMPLIQTTCAVSGILTIFVLFLGLMLHSLLLLWFLTMPVLLGTGTLLMYEEFHWDYEEKKRRRKRGY